MIRFDNRDVGLSHKFDGMKAPHPVRQMIGKRFFPNRKVAQYSLSDMAADAIGVLDALDIEKAHIVGASMGGMIGQLGRSRLPGPCVDLHSHHVIYQWTRACPVQVLRSARHCSKPARAKPATQDEALELGLAFSSLIASEEGRSRKEERRELLKLAQERGYYPPGPKRQMAAIIETGNLRPVAQKITAPTLVIHGAEDPLIPSACGADIADNVEGSRFELIEGMGHDLPPSKLPKIVDLIAEHCHSVALEPA